VDNKTTFHLYNWGEPTLHPQFGKIINILLDADVFWGLSTNCGKTIEYQPEWFKKCTYIRVSMCGFSQESYNKIHKLDLEKVKSNIISLVRSAEKAKWDTHHIFLAQHIYQWNIDEIFKLYNFANSLNVSFDPGYAYINDPILQRRYIENKLNPSETKEISQDLLCYFMQKSMDAHPKKGCNQFDVLVLDEECNVSPCCGVVRSDESYTFANVFNNNFIEKLKNWHPDKNCIECIALGKSPLRELINFRKLELPLFPIVPLPDYSFRNFMHEIKLRIKQNPKEYAPIKIAVKLKNYFHEK
jgi:hypothetical protein